MVFWGSVIDASKAVLYEVSNEAPVLPPYEEPQPLPPTTATNTKTHAKPTISLPSDEGSTSTAAATPSASVTVEAEEGTVPPSSPAPSEDSQISIIIHGLQAKLLTGIIVLLSIIVLVGLFLCRSAIRSKSSAYMALPAGRNVPMSSRGPVDGGGGEESDDDADERTRLRGDSYQHLGFHSGFLDDEEHEYLPSAGRVSPAYRDETLASEALERHVSTSS
jgi:kexin